MLYLFLHSVWATEIFMAKESNGTISFTDSPKNENYVLFDVNGPPPKSSTVKVGNFPLLANCYLGFFRKIANPKIKALMLLFFIAF